MLHKANIITSIMPELPILKMLTILIYSILSVNKKELKRMDIWLGICFFLTFFEYSLQTHITCFVFENSANQSITNQACMHAS